MQFLPPSLPGEGSQGDEAEILMRNYNINIAGYNIRFESSADGPELAPSERFLRNICADNKPDIRIRVHSGILLLPNEAERVFHAPFIEEINGLAVHQKTNFWSIWRNNSDLYIKTLFPLCPMERHALLAFSLKKRDWDLWMDCRGMEFDPLEYPLDGLILYYLTVMTGDIMIHASGMNYSGKGYLFSGVSGKGKSTIAGLWEETGAKVIHDDRLIIRKSGSNYTMYNTPVYNNDEPQASPLNRIFIIDHATSNKIVPVSGALAVSLVMANCIQHNWGAEIIAMLLGSVSVMCETIPTARLFFVPDKSITELILENE
jgi:hypothetical protein